MGSLLYNEFKENIRAFDSQNNQEKSYGERASWSIIIYLPHLKLDGEPQQLMSLSLKFLRSFSGSIFFKRAILI